MVRTRSAMLAQGAWAAATGLAMMCLAGLAAPLTAGVREGVDAWSRGDYAMAVAEWQGPAATGDPDAQFNLGQAYRLGRGVPQDMARAEALYASAAQAGHVQASDTYGLMLFQDGRREQALPLVQAAAGRGDPRAQYLLGIAHFNGDLVPRDWQRAYALLTLANSAGLPQASSAIAQMDSYVPLSDRQQAVALAEQLRQDAQVAREVDLASMDLGSSDNPVSRSPAAIAAAVAPPVVPRPAAVDSPAQPAPIVSPSIAAARAAVEEARRATGMESPADAGASFAGAAVARAEPAPFVPAPVAAQSRPVVPAPVASAAGSWRVQLGAFAVRGNADRLWNQLSGRRELAGREQLLVPAGRVTRLLAGGYATRADAESACRSLQSAGHDCLVTRD